jgi:hypothetical protein
MKDKEWKAKKRCAWSNFSVDCEECSHRKWPEGDWVEEQTFNPNNCEGWIDYLSRLNRFVYKSRKILSKIFYTGPSLPGNV